MELKDLLAFDDIVIQCHDFPDADSVATGFALFRYLTEREKKARLIYSGAKEITKPNLLLMIDKLGIPLEYVKNIDCPQLLVTVDCFFSEKNVTHFQAQNYAAIDHHSVKAAPGGMVEIRSNYGSCSSLIAKMYEEEGISYNRDSDVATALYYGLYMDTNGFSEVCHPADRDLRDFAAYDMLLIQLLKNTNLSLDELNIAGDALNSVCYDDNYRFAITEAKPCDPNILGFISDLVLQVEGVDVCVVYSKAFQHGIKLSIRSCTNDMRADELAKIVTDGVGNGGGHFQKAGGFISGEGIGTEDVKEFITARVTEAFERYEILNADNFDASGFDLKKYRKLPQMVGYTLSTDILPEGSKICIRTLEADFNIDTDPETYIMISQTGSIYPISKTKFINTYEPCGEAFSFENTPEYPPRIISVNAGNSESLVGSLLRYARTCRSKEEAIVLADRLDRHVKLYTKWDKVNYMSGQPGDYIAVREDDRSDVYIVSRRQFETIYNLS